MVIDNEKAIEILTGIKNFCTSNSCGECPLSLATCDKLFSRESAPVDWEIDLKEPKNNTEKEVTDMSGVNRMKEIVSLLGVEFGEEFNVRGGWEEYNPYHFTRYGVTDNEGEDANHILPKLIRGEFIIEEIPMPIKQKQKHLMESLKILKDHCVPRDDCEGCELYEVCNLLFEQRVKDWKLD